jgi:hypothetical protein
LVINSPKIGKETGVIHRKGSVTLEFLEWLPAVVAEMKGFASRRSERAGQFGIGGIAERARNGSLAA